MFVSLPLLESKTRRSHSHTTPSAFGIGALSSSPGPMIVPRVPCFHGTVKVTQVKLVQPARKPQAVQDAFEYDLTQIHKRSYNILDFFW